VADVKISALPAVVTPAAADEFVVNQGGTSRKETRAQVHTLEAAESITGADAAGVAILGEAATATNPTLCPNKADLDTGAGWVAADQLSLIAGGVEVVRLIEDTTVQMILPLQNDASVPSLAFGDGDTGIYQPGDNALGYAFAGNNRWNMNSSAFWSVPGPSLAANTTPSATVSTIHPNVNDLDTGIGWVGTDVGALIAGGINVMQWGETGGSTPLLGFFGTAAVVQPTTVGATAAEIITELVTLGIFGA